MPSTWTYSGDPSSSDKDAVRFEIQDTDAAAPLIGDAEIAWCILTETGTAASSSANVLPSQNPHGFFSACARALEVLARLFSAQADTVVGSLHTTYSKQAQTFSLRAKELRTKAQGLGGPYAGGQSVSEKKNRALDPDAVQPMFQRDQFTSPYTGEDQAFNPDDLFPPLVG